MPDSNIIQIDQNLFETKLDRLVTEKMTQILNAMLDAEADEITGAARYERKEGRKAYRAGHYERTLTAKAGRLELRVPKLKGAVFESAVIERYRRRESSVEEALMEMYLAGVSTRQVDDISKLLWGDRMPSQTLSDKLKRVYDDIDRWRTRPLESEYPYVFMDGVWHKRSWGGSVENVSVLVAIGVNAEGHREVIGVTEGMREDAASWEQFIRSMIERGLKGVRLVVGDRCAGLVSTVNSMLPRAKYQRWIGNGVLDGFLEDESLFGEFLRAPVSEGGVEPLVVGPPHVVVEIAPQLLDRGVVVPVYELLLQQPVRRFDHGVVVGVALARQRSFDVEHVEQPVDPRVVELAAPVGVEHLDVRQREVEGGERAQHQACVPGPPDGMADDAPVRQVDQQTHVRPVSADADIGKIARQMRVRGVAVELAVQQVREPGLVDPRPVGLERLARVRARHALFAHDVADASPGRGDAFSAQSGLDLPRPVALAAVAPYRANVAGDRIGPLHLGMFDHPVVGGAGNAEDSALR